MGNTSSDIFDVAAQGNESKVVEILEEDPKTLENISDVRDSLQRTPLHIAAANGYTNLCIKLIDKGISKECRNSDGVTPLNTALWNKQKDTAKALIKIGCNVNSENKFGHQPMHFAVRAGFTDIIELLIKNGANPKVIAKTGRTPLHDACYYGKVNAIKALVELGKLSPNDMSKEDANGDTPLTLSFTRENMDCAVTIIKLGADVKHVNTINGCTPLYYACKYGHKQVTKSRNLIAKKRGSNITGARLSQTININQDIDAWEVAKILLQSGAILNKFADKDGITALHFATADEQVLRMMLSQGADKDAQDNQGRTPLHWSSDWGFEKSAMILLDNGANVRVRDINTGMTALHHAVLTGNIHLVRDLVNRNADVNLPTADNITPIKMACQSGNFEVVKFLKSSGASVDDIWKADWLNICCTPPILMAEHMPCKSCLCDDCMLWYYYIDYHGWNYWNHSIWPSHREEQKPCIDCLSNCIPCTFWSCVITCSIGYCGPNNEHCLPDSCYTNEADEQRKRQEIQSRKEHEFKLEAKLRRSGVNVMTESQLLQVQRDLEKKAIIEMIKEGRHASLLEETRPTLGRTPTSYRPYTHEQ